MKLTVLSSQAAQVENGVMFDDVSTDAVGQWSQICQSCKDKHFADAVLDPDGSGICGVKDCMNEADYYFDFE